MGTNTTNDRYGESPARAQIRHAGSATIAAAMTNDIRVSKTEPSLLPTPWNGRAFVSREMRRQRMLKPGTVENVTQLRGAFHTARDGSAGILRGVVNPIAIDRG